MHLIAIKHLTALEVSFLDKNIIVQIFSLILFNKSVFKRDHIDILEEEQRVRLQNGWELLSYFLKSLSG